MAITIGINGFGRIGRVALRIAINQPDTFKVCGINVRNADLGYMKYMIRYDSTFGRFQGELDTYENGLIIEGQKIPVFSESDAALIPWGACGAEYIIDATGAYCTTEKAKAHLEGGAKKVIISAPAKDGDTPTFIMGINHDKYTSDMPVVSNASCTTNCLAPICKVLEDNYGIEYGLMSTIHAATAKQKVVDSRSQKDWRTGRSAFGNLIPSTTGAAKAISLVIPALKDKMSGISYRVPTSDVSIVDLNVALKQSASYDEEHGWEKWNDEAENHTEAASASKAEKAASVAEGKLKSRKAPFSGIMRQKTLNKIAGRERDAWEAVRQSRSAGRLNASDYIRILFDDFTEFHGDRYYGDDMAVIGGVASFYGMPVTVIGQERGKSPKDSMKHNFGMPSPEGYRKAFRLMKQAAKFNRPIICFVDTPGAFPGMEAEERGQGEAIARNLFEMSDMKVPILAIITGQGGSGGALALAVSNEVWMMENATYSILSPEGFASILWKDAKRASEAAKVMKMTAEDLYELGMIERIICEDEPATDDNIEEIGRIIDRHMREFFQSCAEKTPDEIAEQRYERFRKI